MNVSVWRSGMIQFHKGPTPDGALPLFNEITPAEAKKIKVMARLSYDNKTLLVPGIPEAKNEDEAHAALQRFKNMIQHKTLDAFI